MYYPWNINGVNTNAQCIDKNTVLTQDRGKGKGDSLTQQLPSKQYISYIKKKSCDVIICLITGDPENARNPKFIHP